MVLGSDFCVGVGGITHQVDGLLHGQEIVLQKLVIFDF